MAPVSPRRAVRINSPFTKDQSTWIIFQYGALRNCLAVRRKFRLHFMISPSKIPHISAFKRLVARFSGTGDVSPKSKTGGRPDITDEMVEDVKDFLLPYTTSRKSVSLNTLANSLGISYTTAWRIVRKRLGWYPYKPRNVVPLTERHKADRVVFCDWLLEQAEGFEQKVM
jgi:transposase